MLCKNVKRRLRKKPDITVYAEINICWETDRRKSVKEEVEFINSRLKEPGEEIEIFSRKIKGKKVNRWVWSTGKVKTYHVDKVLDKVLVRFSDKVKVMQDIKRAINANISLEIVIEMNKKEVPSLVIDERVIDFIQKIGGYIDVDMYVV